MLTVNICSAPVLKLGYICCETLCHHSSRAFTLLLDDVLLELNCMSLFSADIYILVSYSYYCRLEEQVCLLKALSTFSSCITWFNQIYNTCLQTLFFTRKKNQQSYAGRNSLTPGSSKRWPLLCSWRISFSFLSCLQNNSAIMKIFNIWHCDTHRAGLVNGWDSHEGDISLPMSENG